MSHFSPLQTYCTVVDWLESIEPVNVDTASSVSDWTIDDEINVVFFSDQLQGYLVGETHDDSYAIQYGNEDPFHTSSTPTDTSTSVSITISEVVSEDSLDFVGPHTRSYSEELERLSKQASKLLLPSQTQALRLMPREGVQSMVATYVHPHHPEDFYLPVPRPPRQYGRRFKKMINKMFKRGA